MPSRKTQSILLCLSAILLIAATLLVWQIAQNKQAILDDLSSAIPQATVMPGEEIDEATEEAEPSGGVQGESTSLSLVTKVVDGDTFVINNDQTIRLIGIDTPETVDPRRPVGCYGKEASNTTKQLLLGKQVRLEKDISETDKYGRTLRYVFIQTEQGEIFLDDYLVRNGFAQVKTYPPDVKYQQQFLQAQQEAREQKRGLWGACQ